MRKRRPIRDAGTTRSTSPYRPPADVADRWRAYRLDKSPRNRARVAEASLYVAEYVAARAHERLPRQFELSDVFQSATLALLRCVEAFDPGRGVEFQTYAAPRCRGAVLDYLRELDGQNGVTRQIRTRANRLAGAEATLGGDATDERVQSRLGTTDEEMARMRRDAARVAKPPCSTDRVLFTDEMGRKRRGTDFVYDPAPGPAEQAESRDWLRRALRGLDRTDRIIVALYYGEDLTMAEVGAAAGISESRVSQRHTNLLKRLRAAGPERFGLEPGQAFPVRAGRTGPVRGDDNGVA